MNLKLPGSLRWQSLQTPASRGDKEYCSGLTRRRADNTMTFLQHHCWVSAVIRSEDMWVPRIEPRSSGLAATVFIGFCIFIQLYLQNKAIHCNTSDNTQRAVCLLRQLTSSIPFVRQFQMAVFLKLRQKYVFRPFLSIDSSSVTNHQK